MNKIIILIILFYFVFNAGILVGWMLGKLYIKEHNSKCENKEDIKIK